MSELANEFDITQSLGIKGIRTPLRRGLYQNKEAFAYTYFDGVSLKHHLASRTLPLDEALTIAIRLTALLKQLHEQGVCHLRLNSHHVLYQPGTGSIQLIDFSLANRQPISRALDFQDWGDELAYVAPEQMGRWNQVADNRTDLYSLGVILYELLTGQLPFVDDDLAKLVHYHLVRLPTPPYLISERIPLVLSTVVEKLLDKRPDERYQTAHGLFQDLQQCADDLRQGRPIQLTGLGRFDGSGWLQLTGHLYGRHDAIRQAEADLMQVTAGQKRLYLVSGERGTGKTALVDQLKKISNQQDRILLTATCEPSDPMAPYGPFLNGLRELATTLLSLPNKRLDYWQSVLKTAVGNQQSALTLLIPEFHWILEPNSPERLVADQTNDLRALPTLFQAILRGLAGLSLPVVLVVEDIHRADDLVWNSLDIICRDPALTRLLLVVTTQPVAQDEVLAKRLRTLRTQLPAGHSVELTNLTLSDVQAFIRDSLPMDTVDSFSQVVYAKTAGNPQFLREFLTDRFADKTVWFDPDQLRWAWNPDRLAGSSPTAAVVERIIGQLAQLPPEHAQVLQLAACYGKPVTATVLAVLLAHSVTGFDGVLSSFVTGQILSKAEGAYQFSHDQIRETVYKAMPEAERSRLHHQIARFLSAPGQIADSSALVYDLATHHMLGSAQLPETDRFFIVDLNLKAGLSARQASDFALAYGYFVNGIRLLTEADWSAHYEAALQLHNQATEVGMVTGAHNEAEKWLQESLRRSRTIDDRIKAHEIKLNQFSKNHQFAETIVHLLAVLEEIGHGVPRNPSKLAILREFAQVNWYLRNKTIETIPKMPPMQDERARAFLKVVVNSATSIFGFAPELAPILYFRCIRLSLQHGLSVYAPFSFMGYATIQLFFGHTRKGYAYGRMALRLVDQLEANEVRAKVMVIFYGFISFWHDSLRESIEPLRQAYWVGRQNGDLLYAAFALSFRSAVRLHAGDNLIELLASMTEDNQLILEMNQPLVHTISEVQRQAVLRLVQGTASVLSPQEEDFDESALLAKLDALGDQATKFDVYVNKLMVACLFNRYPEAFAASEQAHRYEEDTTSRQTIYPSFLLYSTIACIKQVRSLPTGQVRKLKKQIARNIKLMRSFGKEVPKNYEHKYTLLQALWHEDQGPHSTTAEYYQTAIAQAQVNNFIHEEALAREHFALFLLQNEQADYGLWMLQKAYQRYKKWGAAAKCNQLENEYPQLITELATAGNGLTIASFQDRYDLSAIIQANQMLSSENTLDGLLRRMIEIVIQNASATNVVILLKGADHQFRPKAVGTNQMVQILKDNGAELRYPESVIQYVSRTGTGFVSHNLAVDPQFMADAYVQAARPSSVCCLTISTQNALLGMLYLENNMGQAAFDAKRVDFFATISSQLAISLDNVFLYEEMESKVQQRTLALEQSLTDLRATQSQLIQREKMASLGELTAGIAHEIQNPLNFVNNFSEVSAELVSELEEEQLKPNRDTELEAEILIDLKQNLQKINHHGGRASAIVRGMLEHSRSSTGEKRPTDLNALADEYLKLAYHGLKAKDKNFNSELVTDFGNDLSLNEIVPQEIGRVLLNLYNNAFYAVQQRQKGKGHGDTYQPTITVSTTKVNGHTQIRVSDNGTGMSSSVQGKIFQPFFTTKPTGEGTGLGLSLSYDIITKGHGGSLTVESQEGEGTTFVIQLPTANDT